MQSILLLVPGKGGAFHYMKMLDIIRLVYSLRLLWLVTLEGILPLLPPTPHPPPPYVIHLLGYTGALAVLSTSQPYHFFSDLSDMHRNMCIFINKEFFCPLEWLININYLLLVQCRMCGSVIFVVLNQEGDLVSISKIHCVYVQ